ncbi:MAG: MFS transporter, partial [Alphaproteobacteria bacterium]
MTLSKSAKNVGLLALCQALFMSGQGLLITIVALIGFSLADVKALATLPLTFQFVVLALTTIPASLLMRRLGRRCGFMIGLSIGMAGSLLGIYAILISDFWWFCAASSLLGSAGAFGQLYRFAAADAVQENYRSRAIGWVVAGGVVAAFVGPTLATWSRDLLAPAIFAGSYGVITILQLAGVLTLTFLDVPKPSIQLRGGRGRPLGEICREPVFIVAVLSGMFGFAVMNLVMTSTPLAMAGGSHTFGDTAFVIQWHALGMFAPSFFTGSIIKRFGTLNVIATGALLAGVAVTVNLSGETLWQFWLSLFLVGIGWNFMFIGATHLLTTVPSEAEKAK